ncbi:MAG: hypothetical protein QOK18_4117 [Mycobacterium sp.]|jgi:hypothetical protein|nr:hypothetical protein [Mycobacterium sp.]
MTINTRGPTAHTAIPSRGWGRRAAAFVTLVVAIGSTVFVPAIAHAAPPCGQWAFAGGTVLSQSNGWTMAFTSDGPRAQGHADAWAGDGQLHGTVDGAIEGYSVNVSAHWDNGSLGKYEGSVDANGFGSGVTFDARNPSSTATWSTVRALRCL